MAQFSKQSMSRHNLQERRKRECCESVKNIFANTKRFKWTQAELGECINTLRHSDAYQKLPVYLRWYVESRIDLYREQLEREHTVFAYWIEGEFVPIKTPKYEKLAPKHVYGVDPTPRNARVYKDDTSKVFYE